MFSLLYLLKLEEDRETNLYDLLRRDRMNRGKANFHGGRTVRLTMNELLVRPVTGKKFVASVLDTPLRSDADKRSKGDNALEKKKIQSIFVSNLCFFKRIR